MENIILRVILEVNPMVEENDADAGWVGLAGEIIRLDRDLGYYFPAVIKTDVPNPVTGETICRPAFRIKTPGKRIWYRPESASDYEWEAQLFTATSSLLGWMPRLTLEDKLLLSQKDAHSRR